MKNKKYFFFYTIKNFFIYMEEMNEKKEIKFEDFI